MLKKHTPAGKGAFYELTNSSIMPSKLMDRPFGFSMEGLETLIFYTR